MANKGLRTTEPASPELIAKVRAKGRTIVIAREGSMEMQYMNRMGANANVGIDEITGQMTHIVVRPDVTKVELLEEFLHGAQYRRGKIQGPADLLKAEISVKQFMIRHAKFLGISPEDVDILKAMLGGY